MKYNIQKHKHTYNAKREHHVGGEKVNSGEARLRR